MTKRGVEIRQKLLALGKTQKQICEELRKRGISVSPAALSKALNDPEYPKDHIIASHAYEVVLDWEKEV